jgi:hypothetical protein
MSYSAGFIKHLGKYRAVVREAGQIIWIEPYHSKSQLEALGKAKIEADRRRPVIASEGTLARLRNRK